MHEFDIAERIFKVIRDSALRSGMKKVTKAKLRLGKMIGFQRQELEIALAMNKKDELIRDLKFEIDEIPVKLQCNSCGHEFIDERFDDFDFAHKIAHAPHFYLPQNCPNCSSEIIAVITGKEMELVSISND